MQPMLTIDKAIIATQWRPNFKAGTAKKFVPIKYPILSGKKTMPSCHFSGCIVSINHMGKQGSSNAIAVVDTQTAPVTIKMLIFVNSFKKSVGFSFSSSILCAGNFGGRDLIWRPKSKKLSPSLFIQYLTFVGRHPLALSRKLGRVGGWDELSLSALVLKYSKQTRPPTSMVLLFLGDHFVTCIWCR